MIRKINKINGILLLDKPSGLTSNKTLQITKKLFGAEKAGHTGSLDPIATGVLPICFGPIAVILAAIASSRGDKRGITALIVAIACTIFGMIAGAVVWSMLEL